MIDVWADELSLLPRRQRARRDACFACGAPLDPALASLADGALFASRYEILGPLGRGGMGMVYRAFDRELGETVAIKVLRPDVARESGRVEHRFRSEIRLARRVRHRNVCSVYGDGEDRGLLYICMELVEGENLARPAREGGGLPPGGGVERRPAGRGRACGRSTRSGIVHRDLKTANLMRDRRGVVRVMDFGIAKRHGSTTRHRDRHRRPHGHAGVHEPGAAARATRSDFRSDLYSLGVVVYELFTGGPPFRGDTPVATILRQLQDVAEPRPPGAAGPAAAGPGPRPRQEPGGPLRRRRDEMRRALEAAREQARRAPWPRSRRPAGGRPGRHAAGRPGRLPGARPRSCGWRSPRPALAALAVHLVGAGGPGPAPATRPPRSVAAPAPAPAPRPRLTPAAPAAAPAPAAGPGRRPLADPAAAPARPLPDARPAPTPPPARPCVGRVPRLRRGRGGREAPPHRGLERVLPGMGAEARPGPARLDHRELRRHGGGPRHRHPRRAGRGRPRGGPAWRSAAGSYEPGTKDGVPVKVRLRMKHTFIGG